MNLGKGKPSAMKNALRSILCEPDVSLRDKIAVVTKKVRQSKRDAGLGLKKFSVKLMVQGGTIKNQTDSFSKPSDKTFSSSLPYFSADCLASIEPPPLEHKFPIDPRCIPSQSNPRTLKVHHGKEESQFP